MCIFYYRLSPVNWYRYSIYFTAFITVAAFTSVWFAVEFACTPIEAAWNLRLMATAKCIDRPPVYMLQAVMGGVTDIMLMVLPLPIVLRLQMSWKQKAAVGAWFGTGIITLIAALARLWILVPTMKKTDTTFVLADGTLWLIVEANLITICGSLPTFRIFLNHVSPKILGESSFATGRSAGDKGGSSAKMRYAMRTFGSSQTKRRQFDTIDEIELGARGYDSEARWNVKGPTVGVTSAQDARRSRSEASDEQAMMRTA